MKEMTDNKSLLALCKSPACRGCSLGSLSDTGKSGTTSEWHSLLKALAGTGGTPKSLGVIHKVDSFRGLLKIADLVEVEFTSGLMNALTVFSTAESSRSRSVEGSLSVFGLRHNQNRAWVMMPLF